MEQILSGMPMNTETAMLIVCGLIVVILLVLAVCLLQLKKQLGEMDERTGKRSADLEGKLQAQREEDNAVRAEHDQQAQAQLDGVRETLSRMAEDLTAAQQGQMELLSGQLRASELREEEREQTLRMSVETRLNGYEGRLDEIRQDSRAQMEQLQTAIAEGFERAAEARPRLGSGLPLDASLEAMSRRLDEIAGGLAAVQDLAGDVDALGRSLSRNIAGLWGEVQLEALLSEMLAPEQYAVHAPVQPGGEKVADAVVVMPGQGHDHTVFLPIDASLPIREYAELCAALEGGTGDEIRESRSVLESAVRLHARRMGEKLIVPPFTTDYGVLFLQNEGLFSEVVRMPGLAQKIRQESHMVLCGPTTFAALLTSLQSGFRSVAIDQRTREIERLLSAIRTDMGDFAGALDQTHRRLRQATESLETAQKQTETIARHLSDVKGLPQREAGRLLYGEKGREPSNADDAWDD